MSWTENEAFKKLVLCYYSDNALLGYVSVYFWKVKITQRIFSDCVRPQKLLSPYFRQNYYSLVEGYCTKLDARFAY